MGWFLEHFGTSSLADYQYRALMFSASSFSHVYVKYFYSHKLNLNFFSILICDWHLIHLSHFTDSTSDWLFKTDSVVHTLEDMALCCSLCGSLGVCCLDHSSCSGPPSCHPAFYTPLPASESLQGKKLISKSWELSWSRIFKPVSGTMEAGRRVECWWYHFQSVVNPDM